MILQFTNKYFPRLDQISRILQFFEGEEDTSKRSQLEIATTLGIPQRQVKSFIGAMIGFGLIFPKMYSLTPFGKVVVDSDPYFEKLETLWMIHYQVSSNPNFLVWNRIINTVIPSQDQFSVNQVTFRYFSDLVVHFSDQTISDKLPGEVRAVFYAYTKSSLANLGILREEERNNFIKTEPADVSTLVFLYCLLQYREKYCPGSSALNIEEVCRAENSPGRVLFLSEYQVRSKLGDLHNAGLVRLEQLANLDQVRLSDNLTIEFVLQKIYGRQDAH